LQWDAPCLPIVSDEWRVFALLFHAFLQKNLRKSLIYRLFAVQNGTKNSKKASFFHLFSADKSGE